MARSDGALGIPATPVNLMITAAPATIIIDFPAYIAYTYILKSVITKYRQGDTLNVNDMK